MSDAPAKNPTAVAKSPPSKSKRSKLSAHHRGGLTESAEDYLEAIANLVDRDGFVSVSSLAEELKLIRPSVSLMIKRLAESGHLKREPYRGFVLTTKGQDVASAIQARHELLTTLFKQLSLDPSILHDDIEGIEHHLSEPTFRQLQKLIIHLEKFPLEA